MDIIKIFTGGFPLTTNRLVFLQETYAKAFSQIVKLAGDGDVVISGMNASGGNISDGVVVINGEILEFRGGAFNARLAVFEEVVNVPYNEDVDNDGGLDLKEADTVRFAQCAASGGENAIQFDTLSRYGTVQQNAPIIGETRQGLFNTAPAGWLLCHGQTLAQADYPELYALIGTTFGAGGAGNFMLPDFRDKFSMGAGGTNAVRTTGGENEVTLAKADIPDFAISGSTGNGGGHSHGYKDGYFIESYVAPQDAVSSLYDSEYVGTGFRGSGDSDSDNKYIWTKQRTTDYQSSHTHSLNATTGGGGGAHENRPEFIAENKIIFVGY